MCNNVSWRLGSVEFLRVGRSLIESYPAIEAVFINTETRVDVGSETALDSTEASKRCVC